MNKLVGTKNIGAALAGCAFLASFSLGAPLMAQTISADEGGYKVSNQPQAESYMEKQQQLTTYLLGSWVFQEIIVLPVQGERVVETVITFTSDSHFERRMTDMESGKHITNHGVFDVRPMNNEKFFGLALTQVGKPQRVTRIEKLDGNRILIKATDTIATRL